ncbi:hypothetical protein LDENG_00077340 [Lucifuga dentata]|nr:hypothetical protein LDENG_00077340 [Lucifuga dentata]
MESAIDVLVAQFKAYAGSDGSSDTLSRDEFHRLLSSQLPNFVKESSPAVEVYFWPFLAVDMESAIKTLVTTFLSSAKSKDGLGQNDFKKLVQNHLGNMMQDTENSAAIKEMQQGLDENKDGKVGFQEYLTLIGYLANAMSQKKSEQNAAAS